ncbi:malto-oligosyltrehalose trehalohydrolase [Desulfuromonas sp. AOP6]|uniref:malto-oligosyltrehalose trehalohydrolase n=1 Tax=Desulfuromonas sp. AOP6 TaxID=1566351 RepID=UPI001BCC83E5|nr:malto-oligosyltrehalose trehalohydrolase [Desulfuromonas sp. AOP6]
MSIDQNMDHLRSGAYYQGNGWCEVVAWAPLVKKLAVKLAAPGKPILPMERLEHGYWRLVTEELPPGTDYTFRLNDEMDRPDPASFSQPQGVHGPSRIVDHEAFSWTDRNWGGLPLEDLVIYELHVGTFTSEGTFSAIIPRLPALRELGVTALELMPVAQFPGRRNWGYDGVCPYAVQDSYGGPEGLKALVDACHRQGLAVILDVVYNHLGPEGNYLRDFGPFFTRRYRTPWGEAVNFDGPGSDGVRSYFIENALYWLRHYHVDALRLDAIHAIYDFSAKPFLEELAEKGDAFAAQSQRHCLLIAESDLNDTRTVQPRVRGGHGLHAQWNDDFHHALHALITGERQGYYRDFGSPDDLAKAFREGFVYDWRHSSYRHRRHGSSSAALPGRQLVVCSQNHDQIGNRPGGERLITLAGFEAAKMAAAAVCFAPCVPLLFMGEEYGETAPFLYFVDFSDKELQEAVRRGRREEFRDFTWTTAPPDPQSLETFRHSLLTWDNRHLGKGRTLSAFYRELLRLRRELPALAVLDKQALEVRTLPEQPVILLVRWQDGCRVLGLLHTGQHTCVFPFPENGGCWRKLLDSAEGHWDGPGSLLPEQVNHGHVVTMAPRSAALYVWTPSAERPS